MTRSAAKEDGLLQFPARKAPYLASFSASLDRHR